MSGSAALKERPHEFSAAGRREEADSRIALPDGSFPIRNEQDLKDALHDLGRAKDPTAARKHIVERARKLGLEHLIPTNWNERSGDKKSMATSTEPHSSDGRTDKETQQTGSGAPASRNNGRDEDDIPQSARALADYHDDLQDLHDSFQKHHGALHEEMQKRYKGMEHPEIKPMFEKCLACHKDHMQAHTDFVGRMCKDLSDAFEEHHPDLVSPQTEASKDKETKVPAKDRGAEEKIENRTAKKEEEKDNNKSASITAAVQTKSAPDDDLDEPTLRMILSMAERFEQKQIAQAARLEKELVGSR